MSAISDPRGLGYPTKVGPVITGGVSPFGVGWEQDPRIDDGHVHEWESVLVSNPGGRMEECVRCSACHCPRCGNLYDPDPCMLRRHHRVDHLHASGRSHPVGA